MTIKMTDEICEALTTGPLHSFRDALHETLPLASIGVYTIWRGTVFVFVGIAGRNLDLAAEYKRMRGVRDRLDSYRSGRCWGDPVRCLCVRPFSAANPQPGPNPTDSGRRIKPRRVNSGLYTRNLAYRFAATKSYREAMDIETAFARGETEVGFPQLNPGRPKKTG
jgi:hypothetical protein